MKAKLETISYPLIDQAWDSYGTKPADGIRLARLALVEDPEQIDAFVILANCTPSLAEKMALLREGVRIGQKKHAKVLARPEQAMFWSDIYTRPFMRANHGLILVLWQTGSEPNQKEAVELAQHLLRINPRDNQGIRFLLMNWLPLLGRWKDLDKLLAKHEDDYRTETSYHRALAAFRNDHEDADELLRSAVEMNPHVPAMIKGRRPAEPEGDSVGFRQPDEAASYAHHAHAIWASVPGARQWIGRHVR